MCFLILFILVFEIENGQREAAGKEEASQEKQRGEYILSLVLVWFILGALLKLYFTFQARRNNHQIEKPPRMGKCKLALEEVITQECIDHFSMLVDDEDLERRELQGSGNPLSCSDHVSSDGLHSCLLGKGDVVCTSWNI